MDWLEFPKWKYSKEGAIIVDDEDAEHALGDGWFNTPLEAEAGVASPVEPEKVTAPPGD